MTSSLRLPRTTPSASALDAAGISDFLVAQAAAGCDVHSLIVVHRGEVVCEGYAAPYDADSRQLLYSLSKTFVSATAGVLVDEGLFGYNDLLVDHFPDLAAGASDKARSIRVRDALAMATGHTTDMLPADRFVERSSLRRLFVPGPDGAPGETFAYNQMATYAIARIIEQTSRRPLLEALNEKVLSRLGSDEGWWASDADGLAQGFSGLHLRTATIASFFQLLADGGVRDGVRILPTEWVEQHRRKQVDNADTQTNPDWSQGYGWQCWMATHGYRGDGAFGQWGIIVPEHDLVIAMTGEQAEMQDLLALVWQHILPAMERPGSVDADAALSEQLDTWWLEPELGEPMFGVHLDADDALGGHLAIVDGLLTWTDSDGVVNRIGLSDGEWSLGRWTWPDGLHLDVAVSAARRDESLVVRVLVTNSPHSFTWTLRPDAPTEFAWRLVPLGGHDPRALRIG